MEKKVIYFVIGGYVIDCEARYSYERQPGEDADMLRHAGQYKVAQVKEYGSIREVATQLNVRRAALSDPSRISILELMEDQPRTSIDPSADFLLVDIVST